MSDQQSQHHTKNEIIIVRRRNDGEADAHHGGVWKIAYADFMTAMMAFFLVMWLINAANEQTKATIASYFNPIKLTDEQPTDKGIKDPGAASEALKPDPKKEAKSTPAAGDQGAAAGQEKNATAGEQTKYSEADYFENPFSVLSEIAQETGQQANISTKGEGGAQSSGPATGASGGEAYRDPFDPDFWTKQVQTADGKPAKDTIAPDAPQAAAQKPAAEAAAATDVSKTAAPAESNKDVTITVERPVAAAEPPVNAGAEPLVAPMGGPAAAAARTSAEGIPSAVADASEADKAKAGADVAPSAAQAADAAELKAEIDSALSGTVGKLAEGLRVTPAEGGVLISLTDQAADGMFTVGSAVPKRDMVLAMEKIGKLLSERKGSVVIRGHTDGRPFKGNGYDNWRLSTARAESAFYMLVRGGLDQQRVAQVSGFADRRLLVPEDPYADANRRIEILVEANGKQE